MEQPTVRFRWPQMSSDNSTEAGRQRTAPYNLCRLSPSRGFASPAFAQRRLRTQHMPTTVMTRPRRAGATFTLELDLLVTMVSILVVLLLVVLAPVSTFLYLNRTTFLKRTIYESLSTVMSKIMASRVDRKAVVLFMLYLTDNRH